MSGDITQQDLNTLRNDLRGDMKDANKPIERRQDETNAELKQLTNQLRALNGKVADHQAMLAAGKTRMDGFTEDIQSLQTERREYVRRFDDREVGENRRVSMHDIKTFGYGAGAMISGVIAGWTLLKILPALIKAAGGTP
jgi:TolA-binding protein